jgi:hypothetical protein
MVSFNPWNTDYHIKRTTLIPSTYFIYTNCNFMNIHVNTQYFEYCFFYIFFGYFCILHVNLIFNLFSKVRKKCVWSFANNCCRRQHPILDTRWFLQSPLGPVFRAVYVLSRSRFVSVCKDDFREE